MAKLFKSISLEERWKNSIYNQGPMTPKSVEQGHIDLRPIKPLKDSPTAQLKKMPDVVEKNSALLKAMIKSPAKLLPFVNTKFRSAISLADRLNQPKLGSTTHLSQYFLSDIYTNYIKITPFGIFNHTSNITLRPFSFVPQQGGQNPVIAIGQINQGGTNPTAITFESMLHQGVFVSNGVYVSVINPTTSVLADALIINPQTIISPSSGPDTNITNPQTAIGIVSTIRAIQLTQGMLYNNRYQLVSGIQPPTPITISLQIPPSIIITNSAPTPKQGGKNPSYQIFVPKQGYQSSLLSFTRLSTFNPDPKSQTPILNVLKYEAQRALAYFTPRIIHGSANLSAAQTTENYFEEKAPSYDERYSSNPNPIGHTGDIAKALGKQSGTSKDIEDQIIKYVDRAFDKNIPSITKKDKPAPVDDDGTRIGSLSQYTTLAYDQIKSRAQSKSKGEGLKDFRADLRGLKGGNGKEIKIDTKAKTVNERAVAEGDRIYKDDFINIQIRSLRDNVTTYFRAFLTNFSDNVNVSWNDINYVGRQDTLKAFKGVTRGGSISFKVAALREEDLAFNYFKLNELIKSAGVGNTNSPAGEFYVKGPLCSLTVGKWFRDTPVVFNSIKYDIQVADYSWDIDKQVPHLTDVSLDFVVLGDINGNPLNSGTNNYFNYVGK